MSPENFCKEDPTTIVHWPGESIKERLTESTFSLRRRAKPNIVQPIWGRLGWCSVLVSLIISLATHTWLSEDDIAQIRRKSSEYGPSHVGYYPAVSCSSSTSKIIIGSFHSPWILYSPPCLHFFSVFLSNSVSSTSCVSFQSHNFFFVTPTASINKL